ncbi:MAG: 16S rRNA (guanine(527)-N(7))-methyltransferase RsmG [Alphaproteobacteria bacterium]|nr:16S rRNA (guanine(527)-N(7))-methyltransferase RsmG [Alphaproteobacteria bacterium]
MPVRPPAANKLQIAGPDDLLRWFPISRETVDRLKIYESALRRWQRAVNLVAPATLPELWQRHFADSLQVAPFVPGDARNLADLGSGAGFPGLVLAAHFASAGGPTVKLVESDQRKAAFLRDTARAMEISVEILSTRIENGANLTALSGVDVFTARALAPLHRLFVLVHPYVTGHATCIFLKGREAAREIEDARREWLFDVIEHPSTTDTDARILEVRGIVPKLVAE